MKTFKEGISHYLFSNDPKPPSNPFEYLCQSIVQHAKPSQVPLLTFLRDTIDGKPPSQAPQPTPKPEQTITIIKK